MEIVINDEADEVIKQLFDSLKHRSQNNLESMKGSKFVFDYNQLLYYKGHKTNLSLWWVIYRFSWLKPKKQQWILSIKTDDKCFQYAVAVVLYYEKIKKDPWRITKVITFMNKYNWEGINFTAYM